MHKKNLLALLLLYYLSISLHAQLNPFENLSLNENDETLNGFELGLFPEFDDELSNEIKELIEQVYGNRVYLSNYNETYVVKDPYDLEIVQNLGQVASVGELLSLLHHHEGLVRIYATLVLAQKEDLDFDWYDHTISSLEDIEQVMNFIDCCFHPFFVGEKIIEISLSKLDSYQKSEIRRLFKDSPLYIPERTICRLSIDDIK